MVLGSLVSLHALSLGQDLGKGHEAKRPQIPKDVSWHTFMEGHHRWILYDIVGTLRPGNSSRRMQDSVRDRPGQFQMPNPCNRPAIEAEVCTSELFLSSQTLRL